MEVPGTKVAESDTPDGAALTFTTTGQVAEVRDRVRSMAAMHEHMMEHGMHPGMGPDGGMGPGMHHEGHEGMHGGHHMVPSTTRVEDVDGGAKLVLTAKNPADAAQLQAAAKSHAEQMNATGHCWMHGPRDGGAP
jgi:hypothetical protein